MRIIFVCLCIIGFDSCHIRALHGVRFADQEAVPGAPLNAHLILQTGTTSIGYWVERCLYTLEYYLGGMIGGNPSPMLDTNSDSLGGVVQETLRAALSSRYCFTVSWNETYFGFWTLTQRRSFPCATSCESKNSSHAQTCSGVDFNYRLRTRRQAKPPYRPWYTQLFARSHGLPDLKDEWPCEPCKPQIYNIPGFSQKCAKVQIGDAHAEFECDEPTMCDYDPNWGLEPRCSFWRNRARHGLLWGGPTQCAQCGKQYYASDGHLETSARKQIEQLFDQ